MSLFKIFGFSGHVLCFDCFSSLEGEKKCPVCRTASFYDNSFVSLLLRTTVNGFVVNCKFEGCDFASTLERMSKHEEICVMRVVSCPKSGFEHDCLWKGPMSRLLDHLREMKCAVVSKLTVYF